MYRIFRLTLNEGKVSRSLLKNLSTDNFDYALNVLDKINAGKENLFLTPYHAGEKMELMSITHFYFDIDGADYSKQEDYIKAIIKVLGAHFILIESGHGYHIVLKLDKPSDDSEFFTKNRPAYKHQAQKLQDELSKNNLPGLIDSLVFAPTRGIRLPGSINAKPGMPPVPVKLLYNPEPLQEIPPLEIWADYKEIDASEFLPDAAIKNFSVDTQAVLSGCGFIQYCTTNQSSIKEPQWYAMLSVVSRLENGRELCHSFSNKHPNYSHDITERKITQAMNTAGPRSCANINEAWGGCDKCPHFKKLKSPILIIGKDFIKTKSNGFRKTSIRKDGSVGVGAIDLDDVYRFFSQEYSYVSYRNDIHRKEEGGIYKVLPKPKLTEYLYELFSVHPTKPKEVEETISFILGHNTCEVDDFNPSGKINLQNGVYDMESGKLLNELGEYKFNYKMTYSLDPAAQCPMWLKALDEIFIGEEYKIPLIQEFFGVCVSGISNERAPYALIMVGDGANGKSLMISVLNALLPKELRSHVSLTGLERDYERATLVGKYLNTNEESMARFNSDASGYKAIVSGSPITARHPYEKPESLEARCKLIFACNKMPFSHDDSHGRTRRLKIVEFNRIFSEAEMDRRLKERLIDESAGIFSWCLEGLQRYLANGDKFSALTKEHEEEMSESIELIKEMGRDQIDDFLISYLRVRPSETCEEYVGTDTIYKHYQEFCIYENIQPAKQYHRAGVMAHVTNSLKRMFPNKRLNTRKRKGSNEVYRAYYISLHPVQEEQDM